MHHFHIAIDGPAGSGKSSISKTLADILGFIHIDTGAMYRAVTLLALEHKITLEDENAYHFLESTRIDYTHDKIYVGDRDVSLDIRSDMVTKNVSLVSSLGYVRELMVKLQQKAAENKSVIMDGRDIGTVVLPHAQLKIFLIAAIEERAKRRLKELNIQMELAEMIEDIKVRDYKDSNRKIAPLVKASDAIIIDTTYLTQEEVVETIILEYKKRMSQYAKF
jgi:cytidylate kinase